MLRYHPMDAAILRRTFIVSFAATLFVGCGDAQSNRGPSQTTQTTSTSSIESDTLKSALDDALDFTLNERRLNTIDHGAWQVLHGVLAFGREFPVQIGYTQQTQSAVEYVLNGGVLDGWTMRPGDPLSDGTIGLRAILEPGTKRGQGHADQWLAILSQCGYPATQPIRVGNRDFTISQLIGQVQRDVPNNHDSEYSWTLIGLSLYLDSDASWTAADGETWSIERLVRSELDQDLLSSACGGTHRLIGISMALNNHLASGGKLEGVWIDADAHISRGIEVTRQLQNEDGSFSSNYFERPGQSVDMATKLATTGHMLEFLATSLPEKDLGEQWVRRAVANLCQLFEDTKPISLECGALYHAAHGLMLYRQRVFND